MKLPESSKARGVGDPCAVEVGIHITLDEVAECTDVQRSSLQDRERQREVHEEEKEETAKNTNTKRKRQSKKRKRQSKKTIAYRGAVLKASKGGIQIRAAKLNNLRCSVDTDSSGRLKEFSTIRERERNTAERRKNE